VPVMHFAHARTSVTNVSTATIRPAINVPNDRSRRLRNGSVILTALMLRRTRRTLWIVSLVLLVLAAAVFLRFKAPPEAARLLPESDGIVYVNLRPLRKMMSKNLKPVSRATDYQAFIDATGIDWERDLEEAAVALHRMPDPHGPNGPVAYSMVLVGKVDGKTLARYLDGHATGKENYAGQTVYSLPSEGRTVRVAQIAYDMIAISNFPTTEPIHSMLDRHRTAALPFSGSTLLAEHYSEMPILSVAWGMGQIGLPFTENGKIQVMGMELPIEPDTTFLASIHWAGALKLRVVELTASDSTATSQAANLNTLLDVARGATTGLNPNPANTALKEVLRTAQITQSRDRVVANATLPANLPVELMNGMDEAPGDSK
jgi:hypothetical protein